MCPSLARALGNVTIVQKGATDIISNGLPIPAELLGEENKDQVEILEGNVEGGLKRVGGQGDILSGSTGVLLAWGSEWVRGTYESVPDTSHFTSLPPGSLAFAIHTSLTLDGTRISFLGQRTLADAKSLVT